MDKTNSSNDELPEEERQAFVETWIKISPDARQEDQRMEIESARSNSRAGGCKKMCIEGIQGGGNLTFALLYILISFFLMSTMFNMREIVGDYLLGNQEERSAAYQQEIEDMMDLRRRSPWIGQEVDEFEDNIETALIYSDQQEEETQDDYNFLRGHRGPLVRIEVNNPDAEEGEN